MWAREWGKRCGGGVGVRGVGEGMGVRGVVGEWGREV